DYGFTKFGSGTLTLGGSGDNVVTGQVTVQQGTLQLHKSVGARPFKGSLVIGDNRNTVAPTATVKVLANDQLRELNFYKEGAPNANTNISALNSITVNSAGRLELTNANVTDTIGNLILVNGRSSSAVVDAAGDNSKFILMGDVTVHAADNTRVFSAALTPPARISGNFELGVPFSGTGGGTQHTITVNDRQIPNITGDLLINGVISGPTPVPLTKAGTGTLLLAGANTYTGATRITAGTVG